MSRSFLLVVLAVLLVACSASSSSSSSSSGSSSSVSAPTGSSSSMATSSSSSYVFTPTFCETYSQVGNATAQYNLIYAVVIRAATGGNYTSPSGTVYNIYGLFNSSGPLYAIFTGQLQYRVGAPNYVTNSPAGSLTTLATHLVGYFGAVFGCRATNFTAVNTYNMYKVHANMSINYAQETYFNNALYNTLLSFGVATADANAAGGALGQFNKCGAPIAALGTTPAASGDGSTGANSPVQICGTSDCPYATGNAAGTATLSTCQTYYPQIYGSSSSTGSSTQNNSAAGQLKTGAAMAAVLAATVALVL